MLGLAYQRTPRASSAERTGGLWPMLRNSSLQALARMRYLLLYGLALKSYPRSSGWCRDGIAPCMTSRARILPAKGSGTRVGVLIMSTIVGMGAG